MHPTNLIHDALVAHGVAARLTSDRVQILGTDVTFEANVIDGPVHERTTLAQLDIVVRSDRLGSRYVLESFAGFGSDREAAVRDAFGKFLLGSFHVLLSGLADHTCENNPAEWSKWAGSNGKWNVCDGPLLTLGPQVPMNVYPDFLEHLRHLFLSSANPNAHWVRVYVGSFDKHISGLDVLLDNAPWPEALALAQEWDWKCIDEYRSLRHFFMAFPEAR